MPYTIHFMGLACFVKQDDGNVMVKKVLQRFVAGSCAYQVAVFTLKNGFESE